MKKVENNKREPLDTLTEVREKCLYSEVVPGLHAMGLHISVQWFQAEKQNKPIKHIFRKEILWWRAPQH